MYKEQELNVKGNPTGRSAYAPEKKLGECPKTELTGKIFCYEEKYFHEKSSRRIEIWSTCS